MLPNRPLALEEEWGGDQERVNGEGHRRAEPVSWPAFILRHRIRPPPSESGGSYFLWGSSPSGGRNLELGLRRGPSAAGRAGGTPFSAGLFLKEGGRQPGMDQKRDRRPVLAQGVSVGKRRFVKLPVW